MARSRLELHAIFTNLLGTTEQEETRVYFQPPSTIILKYPCIIYERASKKEFFSANRKYLGLGKYSVTVVDKNPDSEIPDRVSALPYTELTSHFTVDGLNHDVYTLYY